MVRNGQIDASLARMPHIAMLAGALVIETGGTLVGGIGVSGAPGGNRTRPAPGPGWTRSATSWISDRVATVPIRHTSNMMPRSQEVSAMGNSAGRS